MALVLFVNLDSPFFGLLLIVLAAYALLEPRRHKRGRHYANGRGAQSLR
jgi:hypothetical protein